MPASIKSSYAAGAVLSIVLAVSLQSAAWSANQYPIPFSNTPDWQGYVSNPPATAAAIIHARVMTRGLYL